MHPWKRDAGRERMLSASVRHESRNNQRPRLPVIDPSAAIREFGELASAPSSRESGRPQKVDQPSVSVAGGTLP